MEPELLRWVGSLFAAFLAAFLGAKVALNRTKQEKRWQATYDAYRQILSAIQDIRSWAEETYAFNLLLPSAGSDKLQEMSKRFQEAKLELWSYVHIGELLISHESCVALEKLLVEIGGEEISFNEEGKDENNYTTVLANHCDQLRKVVDKHLPEILRLARADLK